MPKEKKVEYEDKKATRVKLDEDTEYIAVILDADTSWGVEAGIEKVGVDREKKKKVLATYIKDKEWGLLPPDACEDKKREEVAGSIPYDWADGPVEPEDIVVSGTKPVVWTACSECGKTILAGCKFCSECGAIL